MKCNVCPAYCRKSGWNGCLALEHSIHPNFDGCTRSEERIMAELREFFGNIGREELNKYQYWMIAKNPLDSHYINGEEWRDFYGK